MNLLSEGKIKTYMKNQKKDITFSFKVCFSQLFCNPLCF